MKSIFIKYFLAPAIITILVVIGLVILSLDDEKYLDTYMYDEFSDEDY